MATNVFTEMVYRNSLDSIRFAAETTCETMRLMPKESQEEVFEALAFQLEVLRTAVDLEEDIRTEVRRRLTPVRWVEIPGLGRSIPIYADFDDKANRDEDAEVIERSMDLR